MPDETVSMSGLYVSRSHLQGGFESGQIWNWADDARSNIDGAHLASLNRYDGAFFPGLCSERQEAEETSSMTT